MCGSPVRTLRPYSKVARPSGAQVSSKTPAAPRTPFTRRRARKPAPAFRASTNFPTAPLNCSRCSGVRGAQSRQKLARTSRVGIQRLHPGIERRQELLVALAPLDRARGAFFVPLPPHRLPLRRPEPCLVRVDHL